ncbi:unnamed protein product [Brachionus calyciflorus]|uniref:Reverse transcriptase domain-containing protein n=1 Tax=Brachionus calyciflorus TaxID=104777 RepID=A0A814DD29_9BILA|nr:unnamed protein product [Brachionus calyciflorus]
MASFDEDTVNKTKFGTTSDSDAQHEHSHKKNQQQPESFSRARPAYNKYSSSTQYNQRYQNNYDKNYQNLSVQKSNFGQVPKTEQKNDEKVLVVDQNGNKNTKNRPIVGKALFNNTLVNYLCDTGADRSIINIKTFNLIRRHDTNTVMKPFEGCKLYSCINEMKIFGVVYLKRCLIVPSYNLENTMSESDLDNLELNDTVVKPIEYEHIDQNEFIEAESKIKQEFENPNQKPIRCKCRPLPWNLKDKVRLEIENQVKAGIIRPKLNKVIKDDNQPLPSINDLYTMMTDSDVFTKFDLKSAYHQIAVHEESVEVTAFICEFGIFEYLFMPMGIKIAPAKFQKFMEKIFGKFIKMKMLGVFLDDSFIFTNRLKYGLKTPKDTVMDVIQTLKQNSLKISMEKSVPLAYEIELLGNVITKNSIKPNPNRSKCLEKRPKPVTVKDLQSWLGVANYYMRLIKRYAQITKLLYEMMGIKDVPNKFKKKNGALDGKKFNLVDLILTLLNFEHMMVFSTDACEYGYGAVLEQIIDAESRPIAYFSKNYTATQNNQRKDNVVADMLSRLPDVNGEETEDLSIILFYSNRLWKELA